MWHTCSRTSFSIKCISEYNVAFTAGMALANFRLLTHELLNKDLDIVPEESPTVILDRKSDFCMSGNGKYTKHTIHIARRVHFVRNSEKLKMHNIDWFEGGIQLVDIATKNFGENDLNPIVKYIMVRLDNWEITIVQCG